MGTILIVDDHCASREALRQLVEKNGRAVWTCPGLMDTPKSATVSAEGVNGGEGRKAEAAKVFG
jgi:CheY-like chemotaxis protein